MVRTAGEAAAVEIDNLSKCHRQGWSSHKVCALNGISLVVPRGGCFGLLGPGASGKTTLLKVLTGRLRPDSGTLRIFGEPPVSVRSRISCIPSSLGRRFAWLHSRRVPDLLLLDEPLAGLGDGERLQWMDRLRSLERSGVTILLATESPADVEVLCSGVAIMREGRIVISAKIAELGASFGYRMRVSSMPDSLDAELTGSGCTVGLTAQACWIESRDPSSLNRTIDCVRAAGASIQSIEQLKPLLQSTYQAAVGLPPPLTTMESLAACLCDPRRLSAS